VFSNVASLTTSATTPPFSASTVINLPSTGANATTVSALGLKVGACVSGAGIPVGAYVTKIIGSYQVEISAPTTGAVTGALTFNNLSTTVTRFNPGDNGTEDAVGKLTVNDGVSSNFDAIIASGAVSANQLEAYGFSGGKTPSISSYSIGKSGVITCFLNDGKSFSRGQVLLRNFNDPNALMSVGDNLFNGFTSAGIVGTDDLNKDQNAPGNDGLGDIIGGSLELSNVDLTQEFSDLILTQRSFQAASRIITVCDSVLEELVNLKR
jgi:flagellar hook-basal body protein